MFSDLRLDLRFAIRTLTRAPGFTVLAIAVLALGIGANTTVFSVANAFFFRPLPVTDPATIVRVCSNRYSATPFRSYVEHRDRTTTLAGLAAFQMQAFGLRVDGDNEPAFGTIVSGNYFSLLGVTPLHGRLLTPADDRPGAPAAAVVSYAFWTARFNRAPDAVGRTISLNDRPFTIVGVAPEGFTGLMAPLVGDLWVPLAADALLRPALGPSARLDMSFHLVGRLKPGIGRAQAEAELDGIGRELRRARGESNERQAITVYDGTTLHPEIAAPIGAFTAVLMTLVGIVLLIVCVNVANLVLARASGREAELAIRQSLGARRGRVIRQLLTESLLLGLGGAAAGAVLAFWCTGVLRGLRLPAPVPVAMDVSVDGRVLAFTLLAAIAATLAFGVMPALTMSRIDLGTRVPGRRWR